MGIVASKVRDARCQRCHEERENQACRCRRDSPGPEASSKSSDNVPDSHLRRSFKDDPSRCFNDRSRSFAASHSSSNADRNLAREKLTAVEFVPSRSTEPTGMLSARRCFSQNRSCSGLSSRQSSLCSGLMRLMVSRQRTLRSSHKRNLHIDPVNAVQPSWNCGSQCIKTP